MSLDIITPSSLPNGRWSEAYSATLQASGGVPPYVWSLQLGSSLVPGLILDAATGEIHGTPTIGQVNSFVVTVTDSLLISVTKGFTQVVVIGPDLSPGVAFDFLITQDYVRDFFSVYQPHHPPDTYDMYRHSTGRCTDGLTGWAGGALLAGWSGVPWLSSDEPACGHIFHGGLGGHLTGVPPSAPPGTVIALELDFVDSTDTGFAGFPSLPIVLAYASAPSSAARYRPVF